jgi:hypothetical protein
LFPFICDELIAYLNIILLPKTKSTPAKECLTSKRSKVKSKKIALRLVLFAFLLLPFSFFSAFLRGHYPEQVHRVISQLQAEPGLPLPWPIQIFQTIL